MTDQDSQGSDIAGEADWIRIPDDDELWAAPAKLPSSLADPAPPLLNTHEMGWEGFERLVLAMARDLDGAYDVRRYGPPGQAQHGLDVVGFFDGRGPSVYQAKHWQVFRAADLKGAVERYTGGRQPFAARRIVIAVASEARHTATVEMLAKLRAEHAGTTIELWDRGWISERLRDQSRLVARFFGSATADAFCGTTTPAPTTPTSIVADAILRGPVAHLGLSDELARAEEAFVERPNEAATILDNVASRLESAGFIPHAAPVRSRQATALGASGRRAEEAWLRIDLGWRHLLAGDPFSAGVQVHEIGKWGDDAPEDIMRCTNALAAATGVRRDYSVTLDHLAEAVDLLTQGDPHRVDAALLLAEEAVATRQPGLVAARAGLFLDLAGAMPRNDEGYLVAARFRICIADCGGEWEDVSSAARGTYPSAVTALVLARYARHLALIPQPQPSIARWREAIERACIEELNDDAADWLYSLRVVRLHAGLIEGDINDLHRHAQALRAAGRGTLLPESHRARERALASLRDNEWPDALEALRRYLWRSTIGGDLAGEMEAHELLGHLFTETGRRDEAIRHYVIAGKSDKLKTLAGALPDEPLRVPIDLLSPRPWERAAAFSFAAACADLMVDDDAREWCSAAFREIVENPHPAPSVAPSPSLAAFKAFGQLAQVSSEEQAGRFLRIGADLIPRQANTSRLTDEGYVYGLIGIGKAHPSLRAAAVDQLVQALLVDQQMAGLALSHGADLLRAETERVADAIDETAARSNLFAGLALIVAEGDATQVVALARQRLAAAVAPRIHKPGVLTFGTGFGQTTLLVTVLPEKDRVTFARGMVNFANDREESAHNRYQALIALHDIARHLPNKVRDELFEQTIPFAQGMREAADDESLPRAADPLSRFRFSFGEASLAPAGLMAIAAMAHSPEQFALVQRNAVGQLRNATDQTAHSIAIGLAALPPQEITLPLDVLAGHPSPWLRALAAVVWAKRSDQPAEIGLALAKDPSLHVRGSLASSLRKEAYHADVRAILAVDPRRSVRHQVKDDSFSTTRS
jgi:hypothetical protein